MAKVEISQKMLYAKMTGYSYRSSRKAAYQARRNVKANIVASGRVDTGRMLNSIQVAGIGNSRWKVVSYVPYAKYQEWGTSAHGPKYADALRFKPKGAATFVFAKWVRGVTAAHFFEKGMQQLTLHDWRV